MNQEYRRIVQTAAMYARSHKPPPMHRLPCTAIVDTGIFPHMDLAGSITGFYDPVGHRSSAYDDNGHGTHIAGIISGNGQSLDGRYTGIFPGSPIFCVKALNENGNGKITDFIEGIEFLIKNRTKYHIRIINISLGAEYDNSPEQKSLLDCVEHAWDLGLIVCAAAGNNGPKQGSITIPGISRKIITIGTYDDYIPVQNESSGKHLVNYSGRGPTPECILKPDILCPGSNIMSLNNHPQSYRIKSGTSMSTPMIAAVISLVLSIFPDLTPKEIKKAIKLSHDSQNLHFDSRHFFRYFN